jgi:uncharacterized protein YoxC
MNTLIQSQVFFFISSVGFIILGVFVGILLYYLIKASKTFKEILEKIEGDVEKIGDTSKEMLEEMHESWLFNFLFKKKKPTRGKK